MKSAIERSKKFVLKFDPDVTAMRVKLWKHRALELYLDTQNMEVQIEDYLQEMFAELGLPMCGQWNFYVKCKHYAEAYKNDQAWRLETLREDFVSEGYPEWVLDEIEDITFFYRFELDFAEGFDEAGEPVNYVLDFTEGFDG